ncbi:MAG: transporter substrate-binding domain-containing protein [Pseudomonadota bacterium]
MHGWDSIVRRRRRWALGAALAAALAGAFGDTAFAQPGPLQVLTEEYPPLSFTRDGKLHGLAAETVEEIQRRAGSSAPVQVLPWARAYQLAQSQPNVALFSTARTPEREKLFLWAGPLFVGKTSLYARRGSGLQYASLSEAAAVDAIIVPREDYKVQLLKAAGLNNLLLANNHEQMVRMLLTGRGTLIAANNLTLPALLEGVGAGLQDLELVHTFHRSEAYVAFSLGTPEATVRSWQAALDSMKRDGSFARIYARWLPGEAPP